MAEEDTRAAITTFVAAHSTLTLATLSADGRPQAASLFFASDANLRLYWVSGGSSRHCHNLARHSHVAVTIQNETWSWTEIAGVQMEGQATVVPAGPEWQTAWTLYQHKFLLVTDFQAEISRSNFYVFTADWMRLIDNSRGFGHKEEVGTRK